LRKSFLDTLKNAVAMSAQPDDIVGRQCSHVNLFLTSLLMWVYLTVDPSGLQPAANCAICGREMATLHLEASNNEKL
jgi:hypothetical protein